MPSRKKIIRQSGIRSKIVYRDSMGRFATRETGVGEEQWKYRLDTSGKIRDLKIDALMFGEFETTWHRSIRVPSSGHRAGKISAALKSKLKEIGYKRHDVKIDITMTAKTYHGKKVRRKISITHYNTRKLHEHTIGGIINGLFYEHGDRPAYPVKIVKGWRSREVTKKETEKRRQLYDVSFNIVSTAETRAETKRKKRKK